MSDNALYDTIDALRDNVAGKEVLIDKISQENLELKVQLGRYRAIIKAVAFIAQKAIKMQLI